MKKILSLMLVLTMFSSLTACAGSGGQAETSSRAAETAAESGAESSGAAAESAEETPETAAAEPPAEADEAAAAEAGTEAPESGTDSAQSGNILVAYFSWADNAILDENVDAMSSPSVLSPGNVEQLAGWVQEETGGDLFSIRVTDPYPATGMHAWRGPTRSGEMAPGRSLWKMWQIWKRMTQFSWLSQLVVRRSHGPAHILGAE